MKKWIIEENGPSGFLVGETVKGQITKVEAVVKEETDRYLKQKLIDYSHYLVNAGVKFESVPNVVYVDKFIENEGS